MQLSGSVVWHDSLDSGVGQKQSDRGQVPILDDFEQQTSVPIEKRAAKGVFADQVVDHRPPGRTKGELHLRPGAVGANDVVGRCFCLALPRRAGGLRGRSE